MHRMSCSGQAVCLFYWPRAASSFCAAYAISSEISATKVSFQRLIFLFLLFWPFSVNAFWAGLKTLTLYMTAIRLTANLGLKMVNDFVRFMKNCLCICNCLCQGGFIKIWVVFKRSSKEDTSEIISQIINTIYATLTISFLSDSWTGNQRLSMPNTNSCEYR